jgi:Flp pilus assembly protein TadG
MQFEISASGVSKMRLTLSRCAIHQSSRQTLQGFGRNEDGVTAILFALFAIVVFGSMGLAIDGLRWMNAKKQTAIALDAAVLAGGRALQVDSANRDKALAVAQKFYEQNVSARGPVIDDTIRFSVGSNGLSFEAEGNAYIETSLLSIFGISKLPLIDEPGAGHSRAELGVGKNAEINLEVAVMLDVTGSMKGTKLADMQAAAHDLVDIIIWDDQSTFQSRMALIPFSQAVNVGSTYFNAVTNKETNSTVSSLRLPGTETNSDHAFDWLKSVLLPPAHAQSSGCGGPNQGGDGDCNSGGGPSDSYSSCVVERNGPDGFTDLAPGPGKFLQVYDIAKQSVSHVKDSPCRPGSVTIQPLTPDKTKLHTKINSFVASGYTAGHIGTAFSWYTLSPEWGSVWPTASVPSAYGDDAVKKIAILMTDGEYNTAYNGQSNGNSASQAAQLCTNMKAKGITVYTVGFELGNNAAAIDTMRNCATSTGEFYNAESGSALKQAFRDIALRISRLYLSR